MKTRFFIYISILFSVALFQGCGQQNESQKEEPKLKGLTAKVEQNEIPVEVIVIKKQNVTQNIPLTGTLKPIHSVEIVAEVSGKITQIDKKLGDKVGTTDTLAFIDDTVPLAEYKQAQTQVTSAKNNVDISNLNLKSDKLLYENDDISELAYQNTVLAANSAEAQYRSALATLSLFEKNYINTRITSPFGGFISRKYIDLGTMVNPGSPVYRVVDISTLKAEIGIPQDVVKRVRIGSPTTVQIPALNNQKFEGIVKFISPEADEQTGRFAAEIQIQNTANFSLHAGMTAKFTITATDLGARLVVPDYSVITKNDEKFVYKIDKNIAKLTKVNVLETIGKFSVIENSLVEGDTIVVVGMKNLGTKTRIVIETVN